jgi:enoyl-[acyl-carrier protein] reductase III
MIDLSGQVALVTGGSRGIGRAAALRLAEAGADVVLTYLHARGDAEDTAEAILARGRRTLVVRADLAEAEDAANLVGVVERELGRLDIVVSNAAGGGFRPLVETRPEQLDQAVHINVSALLVLLQTAAPLLERPAGAPRSKVVTLSSWGAARALPMYGALGACKAALESMTRHAALELGPRGVNVNCVRAGVVDTASLRELPGSDAVLAERRTRSLVGQVDLSPEAVADAVLFLASPLADPIQGHTLVVDGGTSLHP